MVPTTTTSLDSEKYAKLTFLDRLTWASIRRFWSRLNGGSLQQSFVQDVFPGLVTTLTVAQLDAATIGADYATRSAAALGAAPGEQVRPGAFAGVASDGRSLNGLMLEPLLRTYGGIAQGQSVAEAMGGGLQLLEKITTTQVHDAARETEVTSMTGNTDIRGYLRVVEPGACSRCIVLAGKFYRWNSGFLRHPQCRCGVHQALTSNFVDVKSPQELFDGMSAAEQNRVFGGYGAQSIRDGADISRIVNARKGMTTATSATGLEIKAKTSVFGQQVYTTTTYAGSTPRLMPQSIIKLAAGNRDEAIRLLKLHNYFL